MTAKGRPVRSDRAPASIVSHPRHILLAPLHASPAVPLRASPPLVSARAQAVVQRAMTVGSLLLHRLSVCIQASTHLLLRGVAARNHHEQSAPLAIAGGVGIQIAVPNDHSAHETKQTDAPRLGISSHEQDVQNRNVTHSQHKPELRGTCTRGELLALVVARDASDPEPLLTHVVKHPPQPLSIELSSEQYSVLRARLAVLDAMLSEQLNEERAPDQLVFFASGLHASAIERISFSASLSIFAVNDASLATHAAADAARLQAALPEHVDYVHVEAVLDGCAWDSGLVLNGYNWQTKSLWVLYLDVTNFEQQRLERQFSMIGTLASVDSQVLVVYVTHDFSECVQEADREHWKADAPTFTCDDPFAFARKCGFQVSYATSLRDAAIKYNLPLWLRKQLVTSHFADGFRFACLSHIQRNLPDPVASGVDDVSDVTVFSGVSASVSTASAAAPATALLSPADFEDYISSDSRMLTFEIQVASIPHDFALPEFSVILIGGDPSLGCWDPKQAKKMYGSIAVGTGVMATDLSLSVEAPDVEYKYAVTNAQQDIIAWEVGNNRILKSLSRDATTGSGSVQYIRDEWRS